jgi:hypothetical protein
MPHAVRVLRPKRTLRVTGRTGKPLVDNVDAVMHQLIGTLCDQVATRWRGVRSAGRFDPAPSKSCGHPR